MYKNVCKYLYFLHVAIETIAILNSGGTDNDVDLMS